ncbi:hypothetical protein I3842_13G074000 [Carya illinoinensis]|nr:hypothetical protein I3842_13G074000 [Carya illinoinensis]
MKTLLQLGTSTTTKLLIMGMYGMGGIGKTTLAKAVYNNICNGFEGSSCLLNVREVSEKSNGLIQLQEQLLFDILKVKILSIGNVDKGISLIKQRLHRKSVLIVLDDVDQLDQIYALATDGEWFFGPGSRVIITTRDEHLLVKLGVNYSYKVEKMNHSDSLQLFSWHAFNMPHPEDDFWEISIAAVDYAGGLPLALEVLGSDLRGRSITKWKTTLEKFRKSPDAQIQEILGISFKSLDHTTREVFLDIACFFIGVNIEYVFKILEECGFFPDIAINILVQKSLVKIDNTNLSMHDLIRDMGREIVRQESRHPGMRSRLWSHEDVLKVLKNHMGSEVVEGLSLNLPIHDQDQVISLESEAFANMKNLRLLQIKGVKNLKLQGCIEHLSKELRWICWHSCPLRFLPPRLHLENLVVLDMQYSKIKQVWTLENNVLSKLKVLNLSFCEDLTKSPNFLQVPNLEELILEGCYKLVDIQGFENLAFTKVVSLEGCLEQEEEIDFVKSLLELQWPFMIERRQIYLYGDEIPNWFSHKRTGSSISFHIPSLSDQDRVIKGLVFGVVCRNKDSLQAWHGEISVVFHNKTKGHRQVIHRLFYYKPIGSLNHLVLLQVGLGGGSKIPYGQEMTNGEEIEVSFEFECSQALEYVGVKECGIHLIIQREEEAGSMVMYSEKKKKMMEDDLMQDTPVTKLTRHRPHNWPKVWKYDGIVPFVSYIERNTSTFALLHSLG